MSAVFDSFVAKIIVQGSEFLCISLRLINIEQVYLSNNITGYRCLEMIITKLLTWFITASFQLDNLQGKYHKRIKIIMQKYVLCYYRVPPLAIPS